MTNSLYCLKLLAINSGWFFNHNKRIGPAIALEVLEMIGRRSGNPNDIGAKDILFEIFSRSFRGIVQMVEILMKPTERFLIVIVPNRFGIIIGPFL